MLDKDNQHLFLEDEETDGGSFIANVNKIADNLIPLQELNDKLTPDEVNNLLNLADNVNEVGGNLPIVATGSTEARKLSDRFSDVVNVKDFGAVGDGVTDDTAKIQAAVTACVASGDWLYWPKGTYLTTASISNFHAVRHVGPGAVQRGSDTFWISPSDSQTNRIYVSVDGSSDGLAATSPAAVATALSSLESRGYLKGTWRIVFAAGTYPGGYVFTGVRSRRRIVFEGPDVGGHPNVPTAIIDGVSGQANGLYLQSYVLALVQNIKFQNFTAGSTSAGLVVDYHSNLWTINVHAEGNIWAGLNVNNGTKIFVTGGVFRLNRKGIRIYDNCMVSVGYQSSSSRVQLIDNTEFGVEVRDSSSGHVDYADIERNAVAGMNVWQQSRVASDFVAFVDNPIQIQCQTFATWASHGNTSTFSGSGKNLVFYWSAPSDNRDFYFDEATGRFRWGISGYVTPPLKFNFVAGTSFSGASYPSNARMGIDSDGTTLLALSAPAANSAGIACSTVGASQPGVFQYVFSDNSWRMTLNATDYYRWRTDAYIPVSDNTRTLGASGFRWSVVWSSTGTISTSDAREKTCVFSPDEVLMRAWSKVDFKSFKFIDAVEKKSSEEARIHFGVIAQQVKEAFESEGLDVSRYALFCYDKWDDEYEDVEVIEVEATYDEDGNELTPQVSHVEKKLVTPAGDRYGIRYSEALALEAAYQRWLGKQRDKEIAELKVMLANSKPTGYTLS